MTEEQKEDITALIEEMATAFSEAENGEAMIRSKVGSRFNQRVDRLMAALMDDKLL